MRRCSEPPGGFPLIEEALRKSPVFSESRVELSAPYLGVCMGPAGASSVRDAAIAKFWERTIDIVQSSWSQSERNRLFLIRVVSVLRYLLGFRRPSAELQRVYNRACQKVWKIPFNSVPSAAMHEVGRLGLVKVPRLEDIGRAARFAAILRSAVFEGQRTGFEADERRTLAPRGVPWCAEHFHHFGLRLCMSHPTEVLRWRALPSHSVAQRIQRDLAAEREAFNFDGLFARRFQSAWAPPGGVLVGATESIRATARDCRPAAIACFKPFCNAWPLASRFGDRKRNCSFCGEAAETALHLTRCSSVAAAVKRHIGGRRLRLG